ncbi:MAG: hypothetical protein HFJ42_02990 [Clostridia bacterium]|nr:hypothetical protein [Clostridia bacterium]
MKNDVIIIVEGPQGVGKTTFTNYLRENMAATDLYRLSGIKDRNETGLAKIRTKYEKLIEYMENCEDINMIFDRTFFTNEVYSRLGYQKYSFNETYQSLLLKLDNMQNTDKYDIYLVMAYLQDESLYETRIKRDKHQYQKFEVESSILQQREYLKMADEVEKQTKNIKVIRFENDTQEMFEENVQKYFGKYFK